MSTLPRSFQRFQKENPKLWQAYENLGSLAAEAGPLDARTRELIKLGMAAGIQSESAVHSHTHRALAAGATPAEVQHALLLGITTLGFPTMMSALSWALEAIDQHRG